MTQSAEGSSGCRDIGTTRLAGGTNLRESVAADPNLRVLIVHGWNDLSCPFMGSVLTVDQMPRAATERRR